MKICENYPMIKGQADRDDQIDGNIQSHIQKYMIK